MEELSISFNEQINKLNLFFEKINEKKEELKLKVQNIFTKIRNEVNNREDELMQKIDKQYEDIYFSEKIMKDCEKLPNEIKISLEKGKILEKEYDEYEKNNKLNLLINDCINVEKNIKNINIIEEKNKKFNLNNYNIDFNIKEDENKNLFTTIKNFGIIYNKSINKLINDSLILTKEEENNLIDSWISPNKNIEYKLLYRATRDGDKVEDFHKRCDISK